MTSENENESEVSEKEEKDLIPGYKTLEDFTKAGYRTLMESIRNSNALPSGRDYNYYNTNEAFSKIINEDGNKILKLMNTLLRHYEINGNIRNRSLDEKTELIVEANDDILERVAINIDEINGLRKTANEPLVIQTVSAELPKVNGSWNRINNLTVSVGSSITEVKKKSGSAIRLLTAKNIVRPQTFFKDKINNSSSHPWEPKLKDKPNSLRPLAIFLEETINGEEFCHPYEFELERFEPLPEQLLLEEPVKPTAVLETPFVEITEPHQVDELVEVLRNCKEFAVDLEHHSYRTFMGITCLMQISTHTTDYIIDTLVLRDKLYVLNEVFTKSAIVKIFHGADMDVQWLQRDLSIYVVNLFDTQQAARQLGFSGLSLAYLMKRYCNFVPNKQFQLADWRIRPLPDELKMYAREDTHYLIYIYHMLKNELLQQVNGHTNLLKAVIKKSTEVAKKRYFKPILRDDSYMDFYRKCKRIFDNRQLYALKELYTWRDQLSREEDESTGYVLPNHMLLQISESLPREMQGILACCNPIPPLVRANLLELHRVILKAREQSLEKPIFQEDTRARGSTQKISKINVDSPLHCPHDLSKSNEFRDDLPVLTEKTFLENIDILDKKIDIETDSSIYSIFNTTQTKILETDNEIQNKLQNVALLGPFGRYKLVKSFIQEQGKKEEAVKAEQEEKKKESALGGEKTDERTNEERIEVIREHFLKLSRLEVPVQDNSTPSSSLIQMGGAKKRKREVSPFGEDEAAPEHLTVETPVPNTHINAQNTNKRKSSESYDETQPKKFRYGKANGPKSKHHKNNNKKFNKRNNPKGSNCSPNTNIEEIPSNETQKQFPNKREQKKKHFKNINRNRQNNRFNQNNVHQDNWQNQNTFQPYDYSSVDFRQFQGGATEAKGQKFFKSKFKPKGKKKGGNRGNKSATFGTVRKGTEYGR